ncbi:MAG: 2-iminoacetate synthase ThiH [Fusobacterium sp. JB021]|nr:2-iminoacetate synthase ThiH [Fusobacterium sp. JB021]MDP0506398.1 2-iminoacetate synthase ThiH [Fusobacterium sp. JB019]
MGFYSVLEKWNNFDFENYFSHVTDKDVIESIEKDNLDEFDFLNLLAPIAKNHLEKMAIKANLVKQQYFGNVISLYIPIYVSNFCTNNCAYCGFSKKNHIIRKHQTIEQIEEEAKEIAKTGIDHILLLTGEAKEIDTMDYLKEAVKVLKKYFDSVSIEVMPLEEEEYRELKEIGLDGLTVYQETYNEEIYDQVHISGKKKDYHFRLNTPERGAKAGLRTVGMGPLFGLSEIKKEAFLAGLHLKYLTDKYLNTAFSISLPRINPAEGGFQPSFPLDDVTFVQFLTAFRLFQVKADINISTREVAEFRDHLMHIGVTKLSAGSKTDVGGYTKKDESTCQFEISDTRSAEETIQAIENYGYQPIYKDWQQIL